MTQATLESKSDFSGGAAMLRSITATSEIVALMLMCNWMARVLMCLRYET